ncbi:hypothetical protein EJ07DRAFT_152204 [Lizonia empirigonia]|nr:hypothetical protein EJ07DRAFT_152204 [Lizonia empirigonia]
MEEQPSPTTRIRSAPPRYRVRRHRPESLDSHISSVAAAPKMRIGVQNGEYCAASAVSTPAQDTTTSGIPFREAGGALSDSNPTADFEDCNTTLEADQQSIAPVLCTPKYTSRLDALFDGELDFPSPADEEAVKVLSEDMNSAGLDGVQVIDFAYKLVATKQVPRASSFDAASEVSANGHSLPTARNFSRSNAQEMLIPTEHIPDCPESLADLETTSRSKLLVVEANNIEQRPDEVANEPNQSFQGLAVIEDGVRVIDFAYVYAATRSKQLPKPGKGRARFASRSENAPSLHYKSASMRGSPQNSDEDELLLLPSSVYTPPDQADSSGSQGSDSANMPILPSSVYTPPDTVQGNDDQKADDALTLRLLPASVYTRPDPMGRWLGADVEVQTNKDSRAKKGCNENHENRRLSSRAIEPRPTAEASPATANSIMGKHRTSNDFQTPSAQACLEAPVGNNDTGDSVYAKPPVSGAALWVTCWGFQFGESAVANTLRIVMTSSRGRRSFAACARA